MGFAWQMEIVKAAQKLGLSVQFLPDGTYRLYTGSMVEWPNGSWWQGPTYSGYRQDPAAYRGSQPACGCVGCSTQFVGHRWRSPRSGMLLEGGAETIGTIGEADTPIIVEGK